MEISITRALTELKTIDKRIQKAITNGVFVSINGKHREPDERAKHAEADYQSIMALLKRRREIKSKIVSSNALTSVQICGQDMTIAEAIEMKSSISHYKNLIGVLKTQYGNGVKEVENINDRVRRELESKSTRTKESDGNTNVSIEEFSKVYMDMYGVKLYDPMKVQGKITDLDKFITDFESEIDFVLSEKNAVTLIKLSC